MRFELLNLATVERQMTEEEIRTRHQKSRDGVKVAISQALERHRKLGDAIAIWRDGSVVVLTADQIPNMQNTQQIEESTQEE